MERVRNEGVPMSAWRAEREKLKAELREVKEAREKAEKTIMKQHE